MDQNTAKQLGRGIYLLPNLLTTAGLFAAFYSIVAAMKGQFDTAAIAIFIAMIADGMDGRVARMTNTQSAFGAEYDSLSDMVSFGVAPALVAYSWSLSSLGKPGWLAAFIYTAAAGLRLARFNTQLNLSQKRYFRGLPSPSAAALVASMVWLGNHYQLNGHKIDELVAVLSVLAAVLMISNIRYYSFKQIDLKGRVPFITVFLIVLIFVGVAIHPPLVLFVSFSIYAISGPALMFWRMLRVKKKVKAKGQS